MFKIGEFSKLTQVSIRMLRHYDEIGLLKPAEINDWTGYRMYSSEQIPLLNKIRYLRSSGFQLGEIAEILKYGDDFLIQRLNEKYEQIEDEIREEQKKLDRITLAKEQLQNQPNDLHYNISVKSVPACPVVSLRKIIHDYYDEAVLWEELDRYVRQNNLPVSNESFAIYHDPEYKENNVDVEVCMPCQTSISPDNPFTLRTTETVPYMAYTMVYGDFSNITGAYLSFAGWLQRNSLYQMTGTSRQIVHRGPWNEPNPDNYLTELQIPLIC